MKLNKNGNANDIDQMRFTQGALALVGCMWYTGFIQLHIYYELQFINIVLHFKKLKEEEDRYEFEYL